MQTRIAGGAPLVTYNPFVLRFFLTRSYSRDHDGAEHYRLRLFHENKLLIEMVLY
jgi:hypothetical protein